MASIRRHLLLWLLPGFLVLWFGAGSAIYFSVQERYEAQLDGKLRQLWAALPFGKRSGRASLLSIEDFTKDDFGIYFQVWGAEGDRLLKSENLGRFELPSVEVFETIPAYQVMVLDNGDPVRMLSVSEVGGSLGKVNIVVATSMEEAIAAQRKVLGAILATGLATGALFVALVSLALRSGLRPLLGVGEQAASIEADRLSVRFGADHLPSEVRPIADKLNDLVERLEQSFAREKRFGADLAHELRTPVSALRSIAEVALKWPEEATAENYEDVLEISTELQTTIENLLMLARLEKATDQLSMEDVKISAVVDDCWLIFAAKGEERELSFRNSIDQEDIWHTDPKLFRLILTNLFSNAAEYAPIGSEIRVSGNGSEICVANPAPHLAETDLAMMFDRLWRHDQARTDSNHSGLGLSVAKTCAEALSLPLHAQLDGDQIQFRLQFPPK